MEENLANYRNDLVETEKKLKESYDKLVIALSGGALALSITFIKDIVDLESAVYAWLLLSSWACFIASLATVLGALSFGIESHRKAIHQVDDGTIYNVKPGGWFSNFSKSFHRLSALLLLAGLILISVFVYQNVGEKNGKGTATKTKPNTTPTTETTVPATKADPKLGCPWSPLMGPSATPA